MLLDLPLGERVDAGGRLTRGNALRERTSGPAGNSIYGQAPAAAIVRLRCTLITPAPKLGGGAGMPGKGLAPFSITQ